MTDVLFDLLLRVVAVLVVATGVVSAMRRSSASLRALIWTATLTGVLVLPLISLAAPPLEIAVLPTQRAIETPMIAAPNAAPAIVEHAIADHAKPANNAPHTSLAPQPYEPTEHVAQVSAAGGTVEVAAAKLSFITSAISITTLFVGIWMIGALLLLLRLALGHRRLGELVSSASSANIDWQATVDAVRAELGIRRRVDVRVSHDIDIPVVAGVFFPALLLPASADWTASEKRDVVLHELAHVARWDALAQLVSTMACAMYWFIPITWYAARNAAALREQACDNVVLRAGTRPSLYAKRLLTFAHAPMSTALEPVALAMARPARIQRRLQDILDPNTRRTRLSISFTTAFIAVSLAMVTFVAIVEPVSASESPQVGRTPVAPLPTPPRVPNPTYPLVLADAFASPATQAAQPTPASATAAFPTTPTAHATPDNFAPATEPTWVAPPVLADIPTLADTPASTPLAILPTVAAADVASLPVVGKAYVQQQSFVLCKDGTKNNSINSHSSGNTRTWRLTLDGPGCDVSIRIDGTPTFNREFTDIERISGRGTFEIDVRENGVRRELRIRDDNGRITRTWRVDGRERPYDAEAAAWFGQVLIAVDRRTAFAVDMRLPILLERGGVDAVLTETALIPSDHARTAYYSALSKSRKLSSQELTSVLTQGADLTQSDYYASELLKGVALQGLGDASVRDGVMRLITNMKSDYYKSESIKSTVKAGPPTGNEVALLVRAVRAMSSDHYRAETVKVLMRTANLSSAQLTDVLSIAPKMTSDHHINEMLGGLAARGTLDAGTRVAYLTAARAIESDFHRSEAVSKLLQNGPPTNSEMDMLFTVISEIDSDHYMGTVFDRLLAVRSLREGDLLRAESVARSINSDHTHAEVLRRIGSHAAATDAVRSAVRTTAASLSRHYRESVQRGVER